MTTRQIVAGSVLTVALLGGGAWTWAQATRSETAAVDEALLPVTVVLVESGATLPMERVYSGDVHARRASEIGFPLAGRVIEVLVDDGDEVAKNAPLARLDTRRLGAQKNQLRGRLLALQAELDRLVQGARAEKIAAARARTTELKHDLALAELRRDRQQTLFDRKAASADSRDEAIFRARALTARLEAATEALRELEAGTRSETIRAQRARVQELEAKVEQLDIDLEDCVLRAPFAGTVAQRRTDEGTVIAAGAPVLRLVERAREIRIGVPPRAARDLVIGRTYRVTIEGRALEATLDRILPELVGGLRVSTIVLTPTRADDALNPGQLARFTISEERAATSRSGMLVPLTALREGGRGLWSLLAVRDIDKDGVGVIERHEVEVLRLDGDRALVRGTLRPGIAILPKGGHRVLPGQRVRVLAPEGASAGGRSNSTDAE